MQIMRFFTNPHKPTILALSRPDPKKNVTTLLKAFGECQPLRELANLVNYVQFSISKFKYNHNPKLICFKLHTFSDANTW